MNPTLDQLERLAALLEKGLITRHQFESERDKLLSMSAKETHLSPPDTLVPSIGALESTSDTAGEEETDDSETPTSSLKLSDPNKSSANQNTETDSPPNETKAANPPLQPHFLTVIEDLFSKFKPDRVADPIAHIVTSRLPDKTPEWVEGVVHRAVLLPVVLLEIGIYLVLAHIVWVNLGFKQHFIVELVVFCGLMYIAISVYETVDWHFMGKSTEHYFETKTENGFARSHRGGLVDADYPLPEHIRRDLFPEEYE